MQLKKLMKLYKYIQKERGLRIIQLSSPCLKVSISLSNLIIGPLSRSFSSQVPKLSTLSCYCPTLWLTKRYSGSGKKVGEKIAKEITKASSEESASTLAKVGQHGPKVSSTNLVNLESPKGSNVVDSKVPISEITKPMFQDQGTTISSSSSKRDGDLPNAKSWGGSTIDNASDSSKNVGDKSPTKDIYEASKDTHKTVAKEQITRDNREDIVKAKTNPDYSEYSNVSKDSNKVLYSSSSSNEQVSTSESSDLSLKQIILDSETQVKQNYIIDTDGSLMEVVREPNVDAELNVDFHIPIPPSPPKSLPVKSLSITFNQELKDAVAARKERESEIQDKLTAFDTEISQKSLDLAYKLEGLANRGLLEHSETKAKSKFYNYWIKTHTSGSLDVEMSNENLTFKIGLLTIFDPTIIVSGQQDHPIILCTYKDENLIVWGYLTSEDQKTIALTTYQPFSGKNQTQYLRLVEPYIIKDRDIQELPINQQNNAKNYINNLQHTFADIFEKQVIPKIKSPLNIYDGIGITLNDIEKVIVAFDKHQENKAEVYFEKYKNKLNQGLPTKSWLENINKEDKIVYQLLNKIIKDHEK